MQQEIIIIIVTISCCIFFVCCTLKTVSNCQNICLLIKFFSDQRVTELYSYIIYMCILYSMLIHSIFSI